MNNYQAGEPNGNPETGAITGGAPAAAEPAPQLRGREATARSFVYVLIVLGIALLITALFADQESNGTIGTALAGLVLLALAAFRVTGITGPVLTAIIGFLIGIVLTITAFSAANFDSPQLILLMCGAATFIVSFASLAASRRPAHGSEEPTPGVENV